MLDFVVLLGDGQDSATNQTSQGMERWHQEDVAPQTTKHNTHWPESTDYFLCYFSALYNEFIFLALKENKKVF